MARVKKKEVGLCRTYMDHITYECPTRGTVTQLVEVKVYEYRGTPENSNELDELKDLIDMYDDLGEE